MKTTTWVKLFLLLVLLLALPVSALADETDVPQNQDIPEWEYTVSEGVAIVSRYNGTAETVTIPTKAEINGKNYNIRTIGSMAFQGNETMKTLTVPEGISGIGDGAFADCTALETVTVAKSVKAVGGGAFRNCTSLTSVTINGDWNDQSVHSLVTNPDGTYDSKWKPGSDYAVFYNTGTNADSFTVTFGPDVTRVPAYLFATGFAKADNVYPHLTGVVFSESVTEIAPYAFYRCFDLPSVTIGKNVETIGEMAFAYDDGLTRAVMGEYTLTIGKQAFLGCESLTDLQLNNKLRTVSEHAFENCYFIETLVIPASVTQLQNGAFKNCTGLSSLTINGNLADCSQYCTFSTGKYESGWKSSADLSVFYNAGTNADEFTVTFGQGVKRIPAYLFATGNPIEDNVYAHVKTVVFSDTVEDIAPYAFYACYDLDNLQLTDSIATVGEYAFAYDTGLKSAALGANTRLVGQYAFLGCNKLSQLNLRDNLEIIETRAFENCTALKTLTIPASVDRIDACCFNGCTGLTDVTINADLQDGSQYSSWPEGKYESGWKCTTDYSVFLNTGNSAAGMTVTFGPGVTRIPAYLFATGFPKEDDQYCHVSSVLIPDTVTEIGEGAFYNCYDLRTVLYTGAKDQWSEVTVGENNDSLTDLKIVTDYQRQVVVPEQLQVLDITVRDSKGKLAKGEVPKGTALATVRLKNISNTGSAMVMLATYTAEGQYKGLCYVSVEDFPAGGIFSVTVPVENKDGTIAQLKAFTVASFTDLKPLSSPVTYPAA